MITPVPAPIPSPHPSLGIPREIVESSSFSSWYQALVGAGHELLAARVEWLFPAESATPFLWALHVDVAVFGEARVKSNEVVIGRPDVSMVLAYGVASSFDEIPVVLVREFRSPVRNPAGFVFELPGGSALNSLSFGQAASDELFEETGLRVSQGRLHAHASRQLVSTLCSHHAHLFSVELTDVELETLRARAGEPQGIAGDSERTYVEVMTLGEIARDRLVDWSTLGMITEALDLIRYCD